MSEFIAILEGIHPILVCFLICVAKIMEVTISSLKTCMMVKGQKFKAACLGFSPEIKGLPAHREGREGWQAVLPALGGIRILRGECPRDRENRRPDSIRKSTAGASNRPVRRFGFCVHPNAGGHG